MSAGNKYPIWIVSDMRRRSDLAWFREHHPRAVHSVRIIATEEARKKRGWVFTPGELTTCLVLAYVMLFHKVNILLEIFDFHLDCRVLHWCLLYTGVDDAESECDLDMVSSWDMEVDNSQEDSEGHLQNVLDSLLTLCSERLAGATAAAAARCDTVSNTTG